MKLSILQLKVCKLDHRVLWAIFVGLQLFIIACMLYSLLTSSWVKLDISKSVGKDFHSFKGGLSTLTEENGEDTDTRYDDRQDYYCGFNQTGEANPYKAWCDMFHNLSGGGSAYILFESLSIVALIAWGVVLVAFIYSVNCFICSFFSSFCSWILHYIAFFVWLSSANGVYDGNCNEVAEHYDDGHSDHTLTPPRLCIRSGPAMATFLNIFLPIVVIAFIPIGIITCINKRKKDREGEPEGFTIEIPNPHIHQNQGEQIPGLLHNNLIMRPGVLNNPSQQELNQSETQFTVNRIPSTQPGFTSYSNLPKNIV